MQIPTHFKDVMDQTELHSTQLVNVEVSISPFLLQMETEISSGNHAKIEKARKTQKTRLAPLSFFPLFFIKGTTSGHTQIMLLTMSISLGSERSPVSISRRRDCLDCMQSQCSASFRRVTISSKRG